MTSFLKRVDLKTGLPLTIKFIIIYSFFAWQFVEVSKSKCNNKLIMNKA